MNDDDLSDQLRRLATRHRAGDRLRASVRTQVALQAAARPVDGASAARAGALRQRWPGLLPGMVSGLVAGAALTLLAVWAVPRLALRDDLPATLVADHVRALQHGPLFVVASSDRHTVKPWFQGRLDYAPTVVDLADDGFPLQGGRVELLDGEAVAALVYAAHKHVVNVFVWPAGAERPPQRTQLRGFNVVHWRDGGMQVWAVSDLEATEMERFGQAWRSRSGAP